MKLPFRFSFYKKVKKKIKINRCYNEKHDF